jgi:hypothetical protein
MEQIVRIDQLVIGKSYLEISANDADEDTLISSPDISDRFLLLGGHTIINLPTPEQLSFLKL